MKQAKSLVMMANITTTVMYLAQMAKIDPVLELHRVNSCLYE